MTEQGDIHFGSNPDLVEHYVLGRMDPARRKVCEDHLRECPDCAKAVADEMAVAAGTRRLARDDMKRRLARRVADASLSLPVPWQRIAAIAALLAIVVGVGYFGNWFNWRTAGTGTGIGEIAEQKTPIERNESRDESARATRPDVQPPPAHSPEPAAGAGAAPPTLPEGKLRPVEEVTGRKSVALGKDIAAKPATVTSAAQQADREGAAQQYWATGIVTNEPISAAEADNALKETDNIRQDAKAERSKGVRLEAKGAFRSVAPGTPIVLDQRLSSTLPPTQQALHYQSGPRFIQSLIEERADTFHVLLFVDTPIARTALERASAERIGEDSLVVRVDSQSIGFRLPPALRQTQKMR